jgi:cytochrome P450
MAFVFPIRRHPDQWHRLQQDPPGRVRCAAEECLRYDAPVKSVPRMATDDVELQVLSLETEHLEYYPSMNTRSL